MVDKLGNTASFGSDPRSVETAGNQQFGAQQEALTATIQARYDSLKMSYEKPNNAGDVAKDSTVDSQEMESLIFFFHPDHLGSTSYVTGADGTVAQHVEYIPYGEVFVEERSGTVGTAYLFNSKELDDETGMYYYGARYLDPASAMWISVDPMWEKFAGMSAYNYCAGNPLKMVDPDGRETKSVIKYMGNGNFGMNISNLSRPTRYHLNRMNNDPACWKNGEIGISTSVLKLSVIPDKLKSKVPGIEPKDMSKQANITPIAKSTGKPDRRYKPRMVSFMSPGAGGTKAFSAASLALDAIIVGVETAQAICIHNDQSTLKKQNKALQSAVNAVSRYIKNENYIPSEFLNADGIGSLVDYIFQGTQHSNDDFDVLRTFGPSITEIGNKILYDNKRYDKDSGKCKFYIED